MSVTVQDDLFAPPLARQFDRWAHSPGGRQVLQIAYATAAPYARRFQRTGRRVSVRLVWEQMRDHLPFIKQRMLAKGIMLEKVNGFALNNNFHGYLARHIMSHRPEWAGLFELREHAEHAGQ